MSYDDFRRNFTDIEICNITLDQFDEDETSKYNHVVAMDWFVVELEIAHKVFFP